MLINSENSFTQILYFIFCFLCLKFTISKLLDLAKLELPIKDSHIVPNFGMLNTCVCIEITEIERLFDCVYSHDRGFNGKGIKHFLRQMKFAILLYMTSDFGAR